MEKRYDLKDNTGSLYYVLSKETDDEVLWELYSGDDEGWLTKNKLLATLLNHGNGVKFSIPDNKKIKKMDYDEVEYFRLLLNLENSLDPNSMSYDVMVTQFKI